jgi:hypothetical protein
MSIIIATLWVSNAYYIKRVRQEEKTVRMVTSSQAESSGITVI